MRLAIVVAQATVEVDAHRLALAAFGIALTIGVGAAATIGHAAAFRTANVITRARALGVARTAGESLTLAVVAILVWVGASAMRRLGRALLRHALPRRLAGIATRTLTVRLAETARSVDGYTAATRAGRVWWTQSVALVLGAEVVDGQAVAADADLAVRTQAVLPVGRTLLSGFYLHTLSVNTGPLVLTSTHPTQRHTRTPETDLPHRAQAIRPFGAAAILFSDVSAVSANTRLLRITVAHPRFAARGAHTAATLEAIRATALRIDERTLLVGRIFSSRDVRLGDEELPATGDNHTTEDADQ
jgi:hypothetical protein